MPRLTKIYTRTGDDGSTGLGTGERISKTAPRIEAYGTVDELNACIGTVLAAAPCDELVEPLRRIQNELFHLGAELCVPEDHREQMPTPQIEARHVEALEQLIDRLNEPLPPLTNFILPGGSPAAAQLHVARTVCRRAEREVLRLGQQERIGDHALRYLNRLSDALFVMTRVQNRSVGVEDPTWDSRA